MERWKQVVDEATIARIESLTEAQKQKAAELYSAKSQMNRSGHLTVEQARASLDHWPIYYLGWLNFEEPSNDVQTKR